MKCQKCGRNEANISYTRIVNGDKIELHLCSECAKELNVGVNIQFDFEDMFTHFFDSFMPVGSLAMPSMRSFKALESGLDDFFEPETSVFATRDGMDELLDNIQKKCKANKKEEKSHKIDVKEPEKKEIKKQSEIEQLQEKLQEYIQAEEYEKAAIIRDQIKKIGGKKS